MPSSRKHAPATSTSTTAVLFRVLALLCALVAVRALLLSRRYDDNAAVAAKPDPHAKVPAAHDDGGAETPEPTVARPVRIRRRTTQAASHYVKHRVVSTAAAPRRNAEDVADADPTPSADHDLNVLRRKFGSAPEREALKKAAERRGDTRQRVADTEFEDALNAVPFAERMRLRKQDTMVLGPEERDNILDEVRGVVERIVTRGEPPKRTKAKKKRAGTRLCAFLPANGHDDEHLRELQAALETWGDDATVLFTQNETLFKDDEALAVPEFRGMRALVDLGSWREGHHRRILHRWLLRKRGSSKRQLKGRGELSLPMFYWMWRMRDRLFAHCDWFMKADSDSFVHRAQLMRQLDALDPGEALYVGTQLPFSSRGYNFSMDAVRIRFNVGGPGYIFSRGLMRDMALDRCFADMGTEPIWLIHDDVGTGFCATRYTEGVRLVEHRTTVAATKETHVEGLFDFAQTNHACYACVQAVHPVGPDRMRVLRRAVDDGPSCPAKGDRECAVKLIAGHKPFIGAEWRVPRLVRDAVASWPRSHLAEDLA